MSIQYGRIDLIEGIANVNWTVINYGEDNCYRELSRKIVEHNQLFEEVAPELCDITTEPVICRDGQEFGFTLQMNRTALGWTRDWFEDHTVTDLAMNYTLAQTADVQSFRRCVQKATFNPNSFEYKDILYSGKTYMVHPFYNGDERSQGHSHYSASENITPQIIETVINNVSEHGTGRNIKLFINKNFEDHLFSMLAWFWPYLEERYNRELAYPESKPVNRCIGKFNGADVWIKPWIPENYIVAIDAGTPGMKPFMYRYDPTPAPDIGINDVPTRSYGRDFQLLSSKVWPLRANSAMRILGVSVNRPEMAAVHQFGSQYYTIPTF